MKLTMKELVHYLVVYGVLLVSWVSLMDYFKGNVTSTAIAGLVVFIITDMLAHKYILHER